MKGEAAGSQYKGRILFGTTVGLSARALLKGQLAWFHKNDWEVTLVSTPDNDAKYSAKREGVPLFGIAMERDISLIRDLKAAVAWVKAIRHIRPTVINVGTPKASLLGMFASWLYRVPRRIYTVRGLRLEGARGFMLSVLWFMERLAIAMATDVIAISPSLATELTRRKLVSARKVWLVGSGSSNGVNVRAIEKRSLAVNPATLREQLGIADSSFVIGYVGRVSSAKGVDTLLRAMQNERLCADVHLLIIGSIEDEELDSLIQRINNRVSLVEWTDDVWGYLPVIDTLCLPTLREGFGNVVIEAAAAGIPAITTRVTGAVDTVVEGETGFLVEVGDSEALVSHINVLATSPTLVARLGRNAKKRAQEEFKPETIWQGIEAVAEGRDGLPQLKRFDQYSEHRNLA